MNEVISSILSAERKADEKINNANTEVRAKLSTADLEAEKIKSDAICLFKATKRLKISKAEKKAQEAYDNKVEEGKIQAQKLQYDAQKKIDTACDFIVKEIIG